MLGLGLVAWVWGLMGSFWNVPGKGSIMVTVKVHDKG